jgi:hypothetical protein
LSRGTAALASASISLTLDGIRLSSRDVDALMLTLAASECIKSEH